MTPLPTSDKVVLHFSERSRFSEDLGFHIIGLGYQPTAHKIDFAAMKPWALPCFSVNWIVNGSGWFESEAMGKIAVKKGDVIFRFPYERVRYGPLPGAVWDDYWILFEGRMPEHLQKSQWLSPRRAVLSRPVTPQGLALWRQWVDSGRQRPPDLDLIAIQFQSWWLECVLSLNQKMLHSDQPTPAESFRRRLCGLMARPNLDVRGLAAEMGFPYHSLRRDFTRAYGMGPSAYFIELKIHEARRRLVAGQEAVGKIGARLGFEDAYYFSRIFKKRTGLSPLEYRQSFRGRS